MTQFTMQTGTYTTYNDLLNKIKDVAISVGYELESIKDNILVSGGSSVTKGTRLHLKKGNMYIGMAAASGQNPLDLSNNGVIGSNNLKVLMFQNTTISQSSNANSWAQQVAGTYPNVKTMQIGENTNYWFFIKNDGFLLCTRFSARQYSWMSFLNVDSYNSSIKLKFLATGIVGNSPSYSSTYAALVQVPFLASISSSGSSNSSLINEDNTMRFAFTSFGSNGSGSSSRGPDYLGGKLCYGLVSSGTLANNSQLINRSKIPFFDKNIPFPIEVNSGSSTASAELNKRAMIRDMFMVNLSTYQAEETFNLGTEEEGIQSFIVLPLLEKPTGTVFTEQFGYGIGIAIKIGGA